MAKYYISGKYKQFIYTASADTYCLESSSRYLVIRCIGRDVINEGRRRENFPSNASHPHWQLDSDQPTTFSQRQNKITRLIAWGNVILNDNSN